MVLCRTMSVEADFKSCEHVVQCVGKFPVACIGEQTVDATILVKIMLNP